MSFTFRVVFAGVSAFVPNRDFADKPTKICVLMPDSGDPYSGAKPRFAIDGNTPLRRHFPLLKFDLSQVAGSQPLPGRVEGVWYLDRQRITFDLDLASDSPAAAGLDVRYSSEWDELPRFPDHPDYPLKSLTDEKAQELCWLPDLRRVLDAQLAQPDPNLLLPFQPDERIAAQVILDRGTLRTLEFDGSPWSIDTLDGRPYSRPLATLLVLEVHGVDRAAVVATPLDAEPGTDEAQPKTLKFLEPEDGSAVTIDVTTSCELNPLNWRRKDTAEEKELLDQDFLWHFEFLTDDARERILRHLGARAAVGHSPRLFPHRDNPDGGLGQNNNCVGTRLAAYPDLH